jgi:molybdopterin-guanine dinucleotide biosynthesis protein A
MLTKNEKKRIAGIRNAMRHFKRVRVDTSSWDAPFFLGIIDKLLKQTKGRKHENKR